MKILIVSDAYFPIESPRSFRTQELVHEFINRGYKVTLATSKSIGRLSYELKNFELIEWNQHQKLWSFLTRIRLLRGILKFFFDLPESVKSLYIYLLLKSKRINNFDLVISIAYPHSVHWGVYFLTLTNMLKYNTWITDSGDPYSGCETDRLPKPFFLRILERKTFETSSYLTVPFSGAKNAYSYSFASKIRIIPQAFNFVKLDKEIRSIKNVHIHIDKTKINFAYAGGFVFGKREPYHLIDQLTKFENKFCFHIFTKEAIDLNIESVKVLLDNDKLVIHSALPRTKLLYTLKQMDFLVNLSNRNQSQLPSKIIDYIYLDKPFFTYEYDKNSVEKLNKFINLNFIESEHTLYSLENYKIQNVVNQIIGLHNINA